jgi:hypothetical protein
MNMRTLDLRPATASLVVAVLVTAVVGSGCTPRSFCQKQAECAADQLDIDFEPDSVEVCVVNYETAIAALNANEEDECHILAAAQQRFDACRVSLDCNDFFDDDDIEDTCGDQLDDLVNALEDVTGDECTAQES